MPQLSINRLRLKRLKRILTHGLFAYWHWSVNDFLPPATYKIKKRTLLVNSLKNTPWIETGTYLGETTEFLARHSPQVTTIEPSLLHYLYAKKRFKHKKNITLKNSTSEIVLEEIISQLSGKYNFYFDGHYSGDGTFLGGQKTPIREELAILEKYLLRFSELFVAIDDFRVFGKNDGTYPSRNFLVNYCQRNNLEWKVENDLFMFFK